MVDGRRTRTSQVEVETDDDQDSVQLELEVSYSPSPPPLVTPSPRSLTPDEQGDQDGVGEPIPTYHGLLTHQAPHNFCIISQQRCAEIIRKVIMEVEELRRLGGIDLEIFN